MRKRNGNMCTIFLLLQLQNRKRCYSYCIGTNDWISPYINIFRGTRWEQSVISGGCFISRESWKRSRGKTRFADTCHEHRWSSPSLTSHFQPISHISSTFRVVLVIVRFHASSGLIGTDVLRGDRIKQKFARSRSTGRPIVELLSSCIYNNVKSNHSTSRTHIYTRELFIVHLTFSRYCSNISCKKFR